MAKLPFRVATAVPELGRLADGKFTKLVSASPPQVINKSIAGVRMNEVIREVAVPDRLVGSGAPKNVAGPSADAKAPVYPDAIPWPAAGPTNDANRKPFKL